MWSFWIGCFILGAATVGLLHGKWGSIVGVVAVALWFSGLLRVGPTMLHHFLTLGAVSTTVFFAYQEFTQDGSETAVIVFTVLSGSLLISAGFLWIRAFLAARGEERTGDREGAPPRRRRPIKWWAEVLAFLLLAGLPFALGAAAAQSNFNDERGAEADR